MNSTRPTILIAMFAVALGNLLVVPSATCADAGPRSARHFDLVNATLDSVITLAIAPADRDAFQVIDLGQPLQGGLTSVTFDVPAGGCMRDLRITLQRWTYPALSAHRCLPKQRPAPDAKDGSPKPSGGMSKTATQTNGHDPSTALDTTTFIPFWPAEELSLCCQELSPTPFYFSTQRGNTA